MDRSRPTPRKPYTTCSRELPTPTSERRPPPITQLCDGPTRISSGLVSSPGPATCSSTPTSRRSTTPTRVRRSTSPSTATRSLHWSAEHPLPRRVARSCRPTFPATADTARTPPIPLQMASTTDRTSPGRWRWSTVPTLAARSSAWRRPGRDPPAVNTAKEVVHVLIRLGYKARFALSSDDNYFSNQNPAQIGLAAFYLDYPAPANAFGSLRCDSGAAGGYCNPAADRLFTRASRRRAHRPHRCLRRLGTAGPNAHR